MKIKYTILFGTEYDMNRARVTLPTLKLEPILLDVCKQFGGYSLVEMQGGYRHNNEGPVIVEDSMQVIIYSEKVRDLDIREVALKIKSALNQESVIIEKADVEVDFL